MTMPNVGQVSELLDQIAAYAAAPPERTLALPPQAYTDQDLFESERSRVFQRSWFCIGRAASFAAPGDYLALDIAGEPVLVIRGKDGELRALSNVCRHRLHPLLADGAGSTPRLTCPYHLWTYSLDGQLAGASCMADVPGFDHTAVRLPMFRVEQWLGFVFVSLDADAAPLRPGLAGVETTFTNHDIGDAISVAEYHKVWAGNWKLAIENASESLHHMGVHSESVEPYMPGRSTYVREITNHWAETRTPILPDVAAKYGIRLDYPTRLTADDRAELKTVTVFPAFQLITAGDLILWFSFRPLAVDRIDVWSGALYPPSALVVEPDLERLRADLRRSLDVVNGEDEQAIALLQRSASSRYATRGCLSAKEGGLGGFHRYLARQLSGS